MALPGPRREDEEQAGVRPGAHPVGLAGIEDREEARPSGDAFTLPVALVLTGPHDEVRTLVLLVLLQPVAARQRDRDGARVTADGVQELRLARLDVERPEVPVLHARDLTPRDAVPARP